MFSRSVLMPQSVEAAEGDSSLVRSEQRAVSVTRQRLDVGKGHRISL